MTRDEDICGLAVALNHWFNSQDVSTFYAMKAMILTFASILVDADGSDMVVHSRTIAAITASLSAEVARMAAAHDIITKRP